MIVINDAANNCRLLQVSPNGEVLMTQVDAVTAGDMKTIVKRGRTPCRSTSHSCPKKMDGFFGTLAEPDRAHVTRRGKMGLNLLEILCLRPLHDKNHLIR